MLFFCILWFRPASLRYQLQAVEIEAVLFKVSSSSAALLRTLNFFLNESVVNPSPRFCSLFDYYYYYYYYHYSIIIILLLLLFWIILYIIIIIIIIILLLVLLYNIFSILLNQKYRFDWWIDVFQLVLITHKIYRNTFYLFIYFIFFLFIYNFILFDV